MLGERGELIDLASMVKSIFTCAGLEKKYMKNQAYTLFETRAVPYFYMIYTVFT